MRALRARPQELQALMRLAGAARRARAALVGAARRAGPAFGLPEDI
jgi:hypothetical protein